MAVWYWQDTGTSTDTQTSQYTSDGGGTSNGTTWYTTTWYYCPPPRRILVDAPTHWQQEDRDGFTRLLNKETRTGWRVELWVSGDVCICDPNIERRTMKDFVPLIKEYANAEDQQKIDEFFKVHKAE